jgi:hypothetical protein
VIKNNQRKQKGWYTTKWFHNEVLKYGKRNFEDERIYNHAEKLISKHGLPKKSGGIYDATLLKYGAHKISELEGREKLSVLDQEVKFLRNFAKKYSKLFGKRDLQRSNNIKSLIGNAIAQVQEGVEHEERTNKRELNKAQQRTSVANQQELKEKKPQAKRIISKETIPEDQQAKDELDRIYVSTKQDHQTLEIEAELDEMDRLYMSMMEVEA